METYRKSRNLMFLFGMRATILVAMLALVFSAVQVNASTIIGNWSGSSRSWNNSQFSTVKATVIAAGHTVEFDSAMTAANLAGDKVFVIGEASVTPGTTELADLSSWVSSGGVLLILTNSGASGVSSGNAILLAIGSSLSFGGSFTNAALSGGVFATTGPPFNIVGQTLSTTLGNGVAGGNALSGTYIRYEAVGSGFVFAFGDRADHNFFAPTSSNTSGKLFLNLAAIPEPASLSFLALGGLALWRRRKASKIEN